MALPDLLAVSEVVGSDATAGCELVPAEADDHLVVGDDGCRSNGFAVIRKGVLDGPLFLAAGGIQCNHEAIESTEDERAAGIREPAVDRVAASAGHGRLITATG